MPAEAAFPRSIADAAAKLRSRELSCVALTEQCLARIAQLQPRLNAFITVTADRALATARERDAELRRGGDRGPLHGIPIAHKDCFDTAGILTTVGSQLFRARVPTQDATVVRRLGEAGAILLGKTHMNEFAAGMSGKNVFFGDARNPHDPARASGGSSSGSACAVAARLCLGASGTDAGGSIRLPAAWTGVVGFRPTNGLVKNTGVYPRSFTFDSIGPLAASVADAALLLRLMAGYEPHAARPAAEKSLRGLRLGVVQDFSLRQVDEDIAAALQGAIRSLGELGAEMRDVKIASLASGFDQRAMLDILLYEFHLILGAEFRAADDREKRFGPVVCANLERGSAIGQTAYREALAARKAFGVQLAKTFESVDALITPTAPTTALPLDAAEGDFDRARRFTLPFSVAGVPAISIPCGFDRAGLPIGMQIAGKRLSESRVLHIAAAYEAATRHHLHLPGS